MGKSVAVGLSLVDPRSLLQLQALSLHSSFLGKKIFFSSSQQAFP